MRRMFAALPVLISIFLVSGLAAQQTGTVRGTVTHASDGAPVVGALVQIVGTDYATQTDGRGRFQLIGIPAGGYEIVARRLGLAPDQQSLALGAGAVEVLNFTLVSEALLIPAVVISASQEQQRLSETTASVGVISGEELHDAKPVHPSSVMSQVPGVWVNTTGGEGHMTSIRQPIGTKPLYLFLEDGVPTRSTGFFNHNALYEVNLPQAERVEVLKGPASALYGSDAIGGVINVETRRPSNEPSLEAYLEGGGYGYGRLMATGSDTWGSNGFRTDLNLTRTDGWRNATAYDRQSGTLRWDSYVGERTAVTTVLTGSRIDQQTAGSSALPRELYETDPTRNTTPISLRNVRAARISSTAEVRGDRTLVSITPYGRWNEMEIIPNWALTYDPTIYTTGHSSIGVLARVRRNFDRIQGRVIGGIDIDHSPGGRKETRISATRTDGVFSQYTIGDLIYDYDVRFRGISPYLQIDVSPTAALHLTGGLRYDHMSYDYRTRLEPIQTGRWRRPDDSTLSYGSLSPKVGVAYDFGSALNVYGNVNRGFRAPSEGQLFRQGSAVNTLDLEPVEATSFEAGVRGELFGRIGYSLGAYDMTMTNDILSYTLPDGTPETQNAGETRHRGIEAGLNLWVSDEVRGNVSYTLASHRYEVWSPRPGVDYAGKKMEAAPSSILNGRLNYEPSFLPDSRLGMEWSWLGEYWLDPQNTERYNGHHLFNLYANVALPHDLELIGRVTNLADTRYAELASYTQARGAELAPGMPRTVYLGLQYIWER
jgi:iron complex outermembrane receptor protein